MNSPSSIHDEDDHDDGEVFLDDADIIHEVTVDDEGSLSFVLSTHFHIHFYTICCLQYINCFFFSLVQIFPTRTMMVALMMKLEVCNLLFSSFQFHNLIFLAHAAQSG